MTPPAPSRRLRLACWINIILFLMSMVKKVLHYTVVNDRDTIGKGNSIDQITTLFYFFLVNNMNYLIKNTLVNQITVWS
jgi:hypothetical protein